MHKEKKSRYSIMISFFFVPETLINDYTFVPANNPAKVRHGAGLCFSLRIISML